MQSISVLLPVKNGEKYISESIDSVLNQTFGNFELLIFDDNSSDHTVDIIKKYKDERIRLFNSKEGFIANLNKGIRVAQGKYIARMDADDIMVPSRLEIQFEIMENTNADVCSTWLTIFGEGFEPYIHGKFAGFIDYPLYILQYENFVAHPSVLLRKDFLLRNKLFYENYPHAEDYKLWFEVAKKNGNFYVEPKALLYYRMSGQQDTSVYQQLVGEQSLAIQQEILQYLQIHTAL